MIEDQDVRPKLAISSCLLGQEVRFDGAHKRDNWLLKQLGEHVDYQPICPEVGIGLGIPRPPIRLVGTPESYRVVGVKDASIDVTDRLMEFGFNTSANLQGIAGYVLKSKSPSCGMERVKLYNEDGRFVGGTATGVHARAVMQALPNLPVEEEGRLHDPVLRENFVNRIYVYQRWLTLRSEPLTPSALIQFHAQHKYMVMAHSQAAYQRLGRLLAHLKGVDLIPVADAYEAELMTALKRRVSRARHVNVLQHIQGYLKKKIDGDDKEELAKSIESYRRGEVPLIVPIKLFQHYFRRNPDSYIDQQWYLSPYPEKLGLRNSI